MHKRCAIACYPGELVVSGKRLAYSHGVALAGDDDHRLVTADNLLQSDRRAPRRGLLSSRCAAALRRRTRTCGRSTGRGRSRRRGSRNRASEGTTEWVPAAVLLKRLGNVGLQSRIERWVRARCRRRCCRHAPARRSRRSGAGSRPSRRPGTRGGRSYRLFATTSQEEKVDGSGDYDHTGYHQSDDNERASPLGWRCFALGRHPGHSLGSNRLRRGSLSPVWRLGRQSATRPLIRRCAFRKRPELSRPAGWRSGGWRASGRRNRSCRSVASHRSAFLPSSSNRYGLGAPEVPPVPPVGVGLAPTPVGCGGTGSPARGTKS